MAMCAAYLSLARAGFAALPLRPRAVGIRPRMAAYQCRATTYQPGAGRVTWTAHSSAFWDGARYYRVRLLLSLLTGGA